jgi:hypothetical protein
VGSSITPTSRVSLIFINRAREEIGFIMSRARLTIVVRSICCSKIKGVDLPCEENLSAEPSTGQSDGSSDGGSDP